MSDHTKPAIASENLPISEATYDNLVHYLKYASSAYALVCPRPSGNILVSQFSNVLTDVQGFVARDEKRKELVIVLRGSASLTDFLLDAQVLLVPLAIPGVSAPSGVRVHNGFLLAWDSVLIQILAIVTHQLKLHPGFSIVTTGHSLGGALSTLAAITLNNKFPEGGVRTYSYGSPRIGNKVFADYVNAQFGFNAFRAVHTTDRVPNIIPISLGYHHHGIKYWQSADPASKDTTFQCPDDVEDFADFPLASSQAITPAHWKYFDILVTTPFCL